jgi:hypothetical protein
MGRGGARPGSGRKPKARLLADVLQHHPAVSKPGTLPTTNGLPEIEEFDAPDSLNLEERAVWLKQAPFAFAAGTLVKGTAEAFERYCRVVVAERNEAKSSAVNGANHRGLLRLLRDLEKDFRLTADGKPLAAPKKDEAAPASGLSRFRQFTG